MLGFPGQDKRIGTISVTDPADNYPTHWAYLSKI